MHYYRIAEFTLQSCFRLSSFDRFSCEPSKADMTLESTDRLPPPGTGQVSRTIIHRRIPGGWFIQSISSESEGLFISDDYARLELTGHKDDVVGGNTEWLVRVAIECFLARLGYMILHSAAVEIDGKAYAFTGPSGLGKSTRASAMIEGLGAKLINGDRPLIRVRDLTLFGVPWDGKEQCFRNVQYPLETICEVRRSESVYIRAMNMSQRRKLLMRQSFIPMWDTETAVVQMANITRLAASANIVRTFSGPTPEDVRALYGALQEHHYLKEEPDMKAKPGFILRNVVDEYILMPTGENIGLFNGTVLLNEVSALVWEKLQNPVSREDLLKAVLDEFEVDRATASADLDELLKTLRSYGVIEDD